MVNDVDRKATEFMYGLTSALPSCPGSQNAYSSNGGVGYVGSHTCIELLEAGHEVVVVDNLVNSHPEALERVKRLTGRAVELVVADIRDEAAMDALFAGHLLML